MKRIKLRSVILVIQQNTIKMKLDRLYVALMNIWRQRLYLTEDKLKKLTSGHLEFYCMNYFMVKHLLEGVLWMQ